MLSRGYRDSLPTLHAAPATSPAWSVAIVGLLAVVWIGGLLETMT